MDVCISEEFMCIWCVCACICTCARPRVFLKTGCGGGGLLG